VLTLLFVKRVLVRVVALVLWSANLLIFFYLKTTL